MSRIFQTILHNKKAIKRITLQRTTTAYTSFLTGRSPRPTAENNYYSKGFTKGSSRTNDRSIIILTKETRYHKAKCTAHNKYTTRVYTSFFKPRSDLRWTQKQAQRALASNLLRKTLITLKALQRVVGGTNDRFITILRKETANRKCTGDNKRTTRVYTSFFPPQCELHWTTKQGSTPFLYVILSSTGTYCQVFSKLYFITRKPQSEYHLRKKNKKQKKQAERVQLHVFRS